MVPPEDIRIGLQGKNVKDQVRFIQELYRQCDPDSQSRWSQYWESQSENLLIYTVEKFVGDADFLEGFWPVVSDILRPFAGGLYAVLARLAIYLSLNGLEGNKEKFASDFVKASSKKIRPYDEVAANELEGYLSNPVDDWSRIIESSDDSSDDDGEDLGNLSSISFLKLVKVIKCMSQIFSSDSDVNAMLRGLLQHSVALRWNLVGWSGRWLPNGKVEWDLEDLPSDSLHLEHDFKNHVLSIEWQAASLAVQTLYDLCVPESSKICPKTWIQSHTTAVEDGVFYCPQLGQLATLMIAASIRNQKIDLAEEPTKFLVRYQNVLSSATDGAFLFTVHFIEPLVEICAEHPTLITILKKNKVAQTVPPVGVVIRKRQVRTTSLDAPLQCQKISRLRPKYIDIRDPQFYEKAKSLHNAPLGSNKHESVKLARQSREERRNVNKMIRRQAQVESGIHMQADDQRRRLQAKEQLRIRNDLHHDAVELQKMKTGLSKEIKRKMEDRKKSGMKPQGSRTERLATKKH